MALYNRSDDTDDTGGGMGVAVGVRPAWMSPGHMP